jgi:hypothetical protein
MTSGPNIENTDIYLHAPGAPAGGLDIPFPLGPPGRPNLDKNGNPVPSSGWERFMDGLGGIGTGLQGITTLALAVTRFGEMLTDYRMWRSVGWVILGIVMMILGLVWWLRAPITHAAGEVAKVAAVA